LFALLAAAVDAGWSVGQAAQVLELVRFRAHRWAERAVEVRQQRPFSAFSWTSIW